MLFDENLSNPKVADVLNLILQKGASLNSIMTIKYPLKKEFKQKPAWELPFDEAKDRYEGIIRNLKEMQELENTAKPLLDKINTMTFEEYYAMNTEAAVILGKLNGSFSVFEAYQQSLSYIQKIISIIKQYAQKRGDQEVLEGISSYEAQFANLEAEIKNLKKSVSLEKIKNMANKVSLWLKENSDFFKN